VPDATVFGTEFARQKQALGATNVRVLSLLDNQATRSNILLALARLSGVHEGLLPEGAQLNLPVFAGPSPKIPSSFISPATA
jgi:hypothetical protein